jgi:hypothetical protein
MSRRPSDPATRARLEWLQAIARMNSEAALARLAVSAQGRARLMQSLDALGRAEAPLDEGAAEGGDPAMVQARLAHRRWLDAQRRMLNQRLALVQAEYLTLRPEAQRAFGRAEVLERLQAELAAEARRASGRRDEAG